MNKIDIEGALRKFFLQEKETNITELERVYSSLSGKEFASLTLGLFNATTVERQVFELRMICATMYLIGKEAGKEEAKNVNR